MQLRLIPLVFLALTIQALAGQVPGGAQRPDISISHRDRFYTADQFSNTVSVVDPADNKLLGLIKLGDPVPGNLSPHRRAVPGARKGRDPRDRCEPAAELVRVTVRS